MRRVFSLVLFVCLSATACNPTTSEITADDPGPSTSAAAEPTPSAGTFNDPSAGPDRASDEPRQVPPLDLPATAPGTDAAAAALIDDLDQLHHACTTVRRGAVAGPP